MLDLELPIIIASKCKQWVSATTSWMLKSLTTHSNLKTARSFTSNLVREVVNFPSCKIGREIFPLFCLKGGWKVLQLTPGASVTPKSCEKCRFRWSARPALLASLFTVHFNSSGCHRKCFYANRPASDPMTTLSDAGRRARPIFASNKSRWICASLTCPTFRSHIVSRVCRQIITYG